MPLPRRHAPAKPRSRSLVLLLSCGLWLLYFDLLTSMPGCTNTANDIADAEVDAPESRPIDAAPSTLVDALDIDGPFDDIDGGQIDGADIDGAGIDAAGIDAADIDGAPIDSSLLDGDIDSSFVDGSIIDSSFVDAAVVDAASVDSAFDAASPDAPASTCAPLIVISAVYTAGGAAGASYTNDFVVLHNRSPNVAIDMNSYSIQMNAGASTGAWHVVPLTGTIPANGYYLVQMGSGGAVGSALPTPDQTDTTYNLDTFAARVAIVSNTLALTGAGPFSTIDLVGVGNSVVSETATAIYTGAATDGVARKVQGCTDTNVNRSDFETAAAAPKNSATAAAPSCVCP